MWFYAEDGKVLHGSTVKSGQGNASWNRFQKALSRALDWADLKFIPAAVSSSLATALPTSEGATVISRSGMLTETWTSQEMAHLFSWEQILRIWLFGCIISNQS